MLPYLKDNYGNASSLYSLGNKSKQIINKTREQIAKAVDAKSNEIYFTSCGSESDNWALRGILKSGDHFITSDIEHRAILNTCKYLETQGIEVTYLPVNSDGFVTVNQVENAIKENTKLVSIMYANNEIGTIQPIQKIGQICKEHKILFHTDAVQAVGNIPINVKEQNIDMLSLSGHKIHAPKGIGVLYIRNGIKISPLIYGGHQENGLRAGTENVASIVGLGVAVEEATKNIIDKSIKIKSLRDKLMNGILDNILIAKINGNLENRLSGNLNISFKGVEGESIVLMLDMEGICASAGSACTSGSLQPSHVLKAIGLSDDVARGSVRFSLNEDNTEEEVDYVAEKLQEIIKRLRQ